MTTLYFYSKIVATYSTRIYRELNEQVFNEFFEIQNRIFTNPYSRDQILERVQDKQCILSIHAYFNSQIVGFKSGYEIDTNSFYSWVGGVDLPHRRRGIAKMLMQEQHTQLRKLGFSRVEIKTQNKFRDMMIMNLKADFDISKTFIEPDRGLQIVFEKFL